MPDDEEVKVTELLRLMGLPQDYEGFEESDISHAIINAGRRGEGRPDWSAVKERVESHPEEAKGFIYLRSRETNNYNRDKPVFPVDVALLVDDDDECVPADVLRALMAAHLDAVTKSTLTYACTNLALRADVFEAILDQKPSLAADENYRALLCEVITNGHVDAARILIRRNPEALGDSSGEASFYPIHVCCTRIGRFRIDADMVRLIVEEGVKHNVGGRYGAGGLFVKSINPADNFVTGYYSGVDSDGDDSDSDEEEEQDDHTVRDDRRRSALDIALAEYQGFDGRWECMAIILRAAGAAKAQDTDSANYPTIHATLTFGTVDMLRDAMIYISHDEKASRVQRLTEKDSLGQTPLDVALANLGRFERGTDRNKILKRLLSPYDQGRDAAIEVVQVAASVDAERGRALYEAAVECGSKAEILVGILRAHPWLGSCRDATTGLYPWMLLASTRESKVSDIFTLLLQSPITVEGGIKPPAQEDYLTKLRRTKKRRRHGSGKGTAW